jgi:hypothetical protein
MDWTRWSNFLPPRSPDITPLDYFLWGYVKDIVYRTQLRDIDQLKNSVRDAITIVDIGMLARTGKKSDIVLILLFDAKIYKITLKALKYQPKIYNENNFLVLEFIRSACDQTPINVTTSNIASSYDILMV